MEGQDKIRMADDNRKADKDYNPTEAFDKETGNSNNNNNNNNSGEDTQPDEQPPFEEQRSDDEIMEQYNNDGYGQNADGEYFNPDTDEYDEDYNPLEDENYRNRPFEEGQEGQSGDQIREQDAPDEDEDDHNNDQRQEEPKIPITQTKSVRKIKGVVGALAENHRRYNSGTVGKIGKLAKGAARGAIKFTGAAAGLTMGVAAGLASDDYSNVLKYGAAGIAGGAAIGGAVSSAGGRAISAVGSGVSNTVTAGKDVVSGVKDFKMDYAKASGNKEEYQRLMNERADKAWEKNKQIKRKYADAFIGEDYKKVMEDAKKYRAAGVTDDDLIIKAMKTDMKGANGRADAKKIAATNLAQFAKTEKGVNRVGEDLKRDKVKQESITDIQDYMRELNGLTYKKKK